jgi:hypothetical protein
VVKFDPLDKCRLVIEKYVAGDESLWVASDSGLGANAIPSPPSQQQQQRPPLPRVSADGTRSSWTPWDLNEVSGDSQNRGGGDDGGAHDENCSDDEGKHDDGHGGNEGHGSVDMSSSPDEGKYDDGHGGDEGPGGVAMSSSPDDERVAVTMVEAGTFKQTPGNNVCARGSFTNVGGDEETARSLGPDATEQELEPLLARLGVPLVQSGEVYSTDNGRLRDVFMTQTQPPPGANVPRQVFKVVVNLLGGGQADLPNAVGHFIALHAHLVFAADANVSSVAVQVRDSSTSAGSNAKARQVGRALGLALLSFDFTTDSDAESSRFEMAASTRSSSPADDYSDWSDAFCEAWDQNSDVDSRNDSSTAPAISLHSTPATPASACTPLRPASAAGLAAVSGDRAAADACSSSSTMSLSSTPRPRVRELRARTGDRGSPNKAPRKKPTLGNEFNHENSRRVSVRFKLKSKPLPTSSFHLSPTNLQSQLLAVDVSSPAKSASAPSASAIAATSTATTTTTTATATANTTNTTTCTRVPLPPPPPPPQPVSPPQSQRSSRELRSKVQTVQTTGDSDDVMEGALYNRTGNNLRLVRCIYIYIYIIYPTHPTHLTHPTYPTHPTQPTHPTHPTALAAGVGGLAWRRGTGAFYHTPDFETHGRNVVQWGHQTPRGF